MKSISQYSGFDSLRFVPVSPSPRERLSERTHELARMAGRTALEITLEDYEQAKCEVTGETDLARQFAVLDEIPPMLRAPKDSARRAIKQGAEKEKPRNDESGRV